MTRDIYVTYEKYDVGMEVCCKSWSMYFNITAYNQSNGMVVLAFVINVSVEKFKMRSMCFFFVCTLAQVC